MGKQLKWAGLLGGAVLLCCAALLSDPRGNAVELAERGCGRLCQARALILKARATLDRKADDELSTLRGEHGVRLAARARKQQLALLPSKPAAILRTVARAKLAAAAAPAAELPPPAAAPPLAAAVAKPARLAAAVAAATAAAAVHKLATDGARITKKDLKAFVKDTVEKEEQALSTSGNAAVAATTQAHNTQMGYYADYWDRNGRYGQNWWCWDNPNWRGPFGDPCVEYAVGGDRNFWCDWDGAAAMNACPRSCGTCSYSQLRAEDKARGRDAHLLKERFAPQTLVTAPNDGGVPKADGPSEPVAVARDRGISGKVLTEVEELKDKLKEVLTVTAGMAHDTHAMRKNNKDLSSQEASADLNNFYDKVAATARPRAAKDEAKPNARTASWGIKDLMDWFDGEGAKVKGSPAAQHASLAAKKTKAERQLSASKAKDDLDGYWVRQQAKPTHLSVKSGRARKFTAKEASKDITGYWREQTARGGASSSEHHAKGGSSLPRFSDKDARRDLAGYLRKAVKAARADNKKSMALAAAARELKDAREAVPSKKMTSKEAAADIEGFWKTQPLEAVHVEASSLKAHRGGHAAHEDARSANKASTLKGSANKTANKAANMGSTIKGAAAQPAGVGHAPVAAKAPHGETAAKAPGGEAVVNEAASHGGVETARGGKGGAGEQEKGAAGDGADAEAKGGGGDWADGAASGSKRRAEDMGLPSGRKAAVDTPTGMSAEAAHSSIDDYFGQLVKTSRDNDTFDIKTRVALKARALKRAQAKAAREAKKHQVVFSEAAQHAEWERLQQQPQVMSTNARQQQLYLQPRYAPGPPQYYRAGPPQDQRAAVTGPPREAKASAVQAAEGAFLAGVDREVVPTLGGPAVAALGAGGVPGFQPQQMQYQGYQAPQPVMYQAPRPVLYQRPGPVAYQGYAYQGAQGAVPEGVPAAAGSGGRGAWGART